MKVTADTCADVETRRCSGGVFGRLLVSALAGFRLHSMSPSVLSGLSQMAFGGARLARAPTAGTCSLIVISLPKPEAGRVRATRAHRRTRIAP